MAALVDDKTTLDRFISKSAQLVGKNDRKRRKKKKRKKERMNPPTRIKLGFPINGSSFA